jgi:flagellar hook-basal body complex protein FliE
MLDTAIKDTIATARHAESTSMAGLSGNANVTDVVTAVSKAELTMQTAMTIRDRVVQAYQDIMKMPI